MSQANEQPIPGSRMDVVDDPSEGPPAHLLHGEPWATVRQRPAVVNRHHAGVVKGRGHRSLGVESRAHQAIVQRVAMEDLDGYDPVELAVVGSPDVAHAPPRR